MDILGRLCKVEQKTRQLCRIVEADDTGANSLEIDGEVIGNVLRLNLSNGATNNVQLGPFGEFLFENLTASQKDNLLNCIRGEEIQAIDGTRLGFLTK